MLLQQGEALGEAGQHAERQHIHFQNPERIQIVLVPFHHGAVCHGGILNGHQLFQRPAGHDEAADMLGEMAGKTHELTGELQCLLEARRLGIEAELAHALLFQALAAPAPDGAGERGHGIEGKSHGLAHLAQRRAAAIADDRGGEPGAMAAIFLVDVLNHLLAALMLEIDVDIRRFVARSTDEAFEQQIHLDGIDGGDLQAIADGGVGGRAAALAENLLRAGKVHEIAHGEEIGGVGEPVDQC